MAGITRQTWRWKPRHERPSWWSSPSCSFIRRQPCSTGRRPHQRRTASSRPGSAGRLLKAYFGSTSACSSISSQIGPAPAQSPGAHPWPGDTRSQANRPYIKPFVPSLQVASRRGARAARSLGLTGRGEPSNGR